MHSLHFTVSVFLRDSATDRGTVKENQDIVELTLASTFTKAGSGIAVNSQLQSHGYVSLLLLI